MRDSIIKKINSSKTLYPHKFPQLDHVQDDTGFYLLLFLMHASLRGYHIPKPPYRNSIYDKIVPPSTSMPPWPPQYQAR